MIPIARSGGFANYEGFLVRDEFTTFFCSTQGSVPWQHHETQKID